MRGRGRRKCVARYSNPCAHQACTRCSFPCHLSERHPEQLGHPGFSCAARELLLSEKQVPSPSPDTCLRTSARSAPGEALFTASSSATINGRQAMLRGALPNVVTRPCTPWPSSTSLVHPVLDCRPVADPRRPHAPRGDAPLGRAPRRPGAHGRRHVPKLRPRTDARLDPVPHLRRWRWGPASRLPAAALETPCDHPGFSCRALVARRLRAGTSNLQPCRRPSSRPHPAWTLAHALPSPRPCP